MEGRNFYGSCCVEFTLHWETTELGNDEVDDGKTPRGNGGPCNDAPAADVVFRE